MSSGPVAHEIGSAPRVRGQVSSQSYMTRNAKKNEFGVWVWVDDWTCPDNIDIKAVSQQFSDASKINGLDVFSKNMCHVVRCVLLEIPEFSDR